LFDVLENREDGWAVCHGSYTIIVRSSTQLPTTSLHRLRWRVETAILDMALRLRCSQCGSRSIRIMLNVKELCAKAYGVGRAT
jgi:hypothetical protein